MNHPYSQGYFENAEGSHYTGYSDWPQFKERAQWIIKTFKPNNVLELGAAKGFLLKHLSELGVKKVKGYDISEYASEESDGLVRCLDVTAGFIDLSDYDLVLSFDFLEHVPQEDLPDLLFSLSTAPRQFHMITTSEYDFGGDVTHYTSKPKQWWIDTFNDNGVTDFTIIHAGEQELMR